MQSVGGQVWMGLGCKQKNTFYIYSLKCPANSGTLYCGLGNISAIWQNGYGL